MSNAAEVNDSMDDLPAFVAQFEEDVARIDIFVNGDETQDYTTADGRPVPSLSKIVANVEEMIRPETDLITASAAQAQASASAAAGSATTASEAASSSAASEAAALGYMGQAGASAVEAADSRDRAEAAANTANDARDQAVAAMNTSQQNADATGTNATRAEQAATNSETAASESADSAESAAGSATAANTAQGAAEAAQAGAEAAHDATVQYADAAGESAANAAQSADDAEEAARRAENYGGELEIDLSGGDATLDDAQSLNAIFRLVGNLPADRTVFFSGEPTSFVVQNLTTGDFSVTLRVAADDMATVVIPQGIAQNFFANASGVFATSATSESTQPNSFWYTVGASDVVGSFAAGDLSIRTPGFTAPFVRVVRNGAQLTRGKHYTLNGNNVHIDFADPLTTNDEIDVQTQGVTTGSSFTLPSITWVQPAAGASFVSFPHTAGFAWLMLRGVFLEAGTDYTDDPAGFFLVGFTADGVERFGVLALTPATIGDCLARSANLADVPNPVAARANLGISLPLAIASGGTGKTDRIAAAKALGVPVLLAVQGPTGVANVFNNLTDFDEYELHFENLLPTNNLQAFGIHFSYDNGANWQISPQYRSAYTYNSTYATGVNSGAINAATGINLWDAASNIAGTPVFATYEGRVRFRNFRRPSSSPSCDWDMSGADSGNNSWGQTRGTAQYLALSGNQITAFRIFCGSAGFSRGVLFLYGIPGQLPA
jgi:hypothetical protein